MFCGGGKSLRLAIALALMSGLSSFDAPVASAEYTVSSGDVKVIDGDLTENNSSKYKLTGNSIDFKIENERVHFVGNQNSDEGYSFSLVDASSSSGGIRLATNSNTNMILSSGVYNDVSMYNIDTTNNVYAASSGGYGCGPFIGIRGNSRFVDGGGITLQKVSGNVGRLNGSTSATICISGDADLSNAVIRAYDIQADSAYYSNGYNFSYGAEWGYSTITLVLGEESDVLAPDFWPIWNNNEIKGIGGVEAISLGALKYEEGRPCLVTKIIPLRATKTTEVITPIRVVDIGNMQLYKYTDTGEPQLYTPGDGTGIVLIRIEGAEKDGKYIGLNEEQYYLLGRRIESWEPEYHEYISQFYDMEAWRHNSIKFARDLSDAIVPHSYTINPGGKVLAYSGMKAIVSEDGKYTDIYDYYNIDPQISVDNISWDTSRAVVSTYSGGDYTNATVTLSNLTFDNQGAAGESVILFDGSGLTNVDYTQVTAPTNVTWSVEDNNSNTKTWTVKDVEHSVAGGGLSVTGKREDSLISTVTNTDSTNQNWTVKYSNGEADIKSIEATSSDGGIRLTEDASTLLKLVGDYKISSDFSPFKNTNTHIVDAHHLASNETITLVDFSEAQLTESDWSHLIMDKDNHNNNIHHSAVNFETGDNKAVVVKGQIGADIFKDGNKSTEYALKAKLGNNIAQSVTIDMSKIGSDSSTQEPWKNNGTLYTMTVADGYTQDYSANKVNVNIKNSSATKSSAFKNGETMTLLNIQGKNAEVNTYTVDGASVVQFADSQYGVTVNGANKGAFNVDAKAAQGDKAASYSVSYTAGENIVQQDKGVVLGALQTDNATADTALLTAEDGQYVLDGTVTVDVSGMSIKGRALTEGTKIKIADLSKAERRNSGHLEFASETNTRSLRASTDSSRYRETVASFEESEYTKGVKASGSQDFAMEISNDNVITGEAGASEMTAIALSDIDVADIRSFGDISYSEGTVSVTDGSDEASRITISNYAMNSSSATLTNNTGANSFNGWTFNETGNTSLNDAKVNVQQESGVSGVITGNYSTSENGVSFAGKNINSITFGQNMNYRDTTGTAIVDLSVAGAPSLAEDAAIDASNISFTADSIRNAQADDEGMYRINLLKNKNSEDIDTATRTVKTGTFKGTIGNSLDVVGTTYTDNDLLKAVFRENKSDADDDSNDKGDSPYTVTANENAHYGVQAAAANTIAITNGAINASNVAGGYLSGFHKDGEEDDAFVFGNVGGSVTRTNTGSHVSENMWNAVAGVGKRTKLNNGSTFGYGVFYEGGHGNYTSHNDRADVTALSGRLNFDGVGALLRYETPSKLYGEMGLHVGRVGNKSQHMGLDKSASYWGFSLGGGKFIDMGEKSNMDVYAKFYFNRTGSMNFTALDKMDYNLDAVTSKQLRIGARYNHSLNDRSKLYAGLAYAYEFGGQARGTVGVGGLAADIRPATLRGGSAILELGYKLEATKNNPWEIDLGLTGFAGTQKGFGANLGVKYHF